MGNQYSNKCKICDNYHNGFFVWTSDRRFDKPKLLELCNDISVYNAFNEAYKVCIGCVHKHGLIK